METTAEPPASNEATKPIIKYSPAEAEIAILKEKYGALKADTPEGYDQVSRALREVVSTRTQIEARRKQLKEDSLTWGRQVDSAAKKLQALVAEVETPLRAEKDRVDVEKEAKARAIVEAEKARVAKLERQVREKEEAERKAARDAEETRVKAAREVEEAKLAEQRRELAEQTAKLIKERELAEAERRQRQAFMDAEEDKQREAQHKIDAERRKLAEEKERLDRIKWEQAAKEMAEKTAKRDAEEREATNRMMNEARAAEEKAEPARIEAAKPDVGKIRELAQIIGGIPRPDVKHKEQRDFLTTIFAALNELAKRCESYTFKKGA